MSKQITKVGIVGAGLIGQAIAKRALANGYSIMLSNSRGPETLTELAAALNCGAGTVRESAEFGDLIVVTIPFNAIDALDPEMFASKVVIDTCNHYPGRDGADAALDAMRETTGERLQRHLPQSRVVKAFNAIRHVDIEPHARAQGAHNRRALPIAGDDIEARYEVAMFLDRIGFDVVDVGPMSESWRFERAMPAYCVPFGRRSLARTLAGARRNERLAEGSWRTPRPIQP